MVKNLYEHQKVTKSSLNNHLGIDNCRKRIAVMEKNLRMILPLLVQVFFRHVTWNIPRYYWSSLFQSLIYLFIYIFHNTDVTRVKELEKKIKKKLKKTKETNGKMFY